MRIPRHVRIDDETAVLLIALYRASVVANAENMALYCSSAAEGEDRAFTIARYRLFNGSRFYINAGRIRV